MAKVVGLVGSARGKIGNLVYAVTNGMQVVRVYQPNVSNPKTSLQLIQRAKGNLVGRVSSFVPRTAIMGLGINNRGRRGELLRTLLKAAQVGVVDGVYKAKLRDEDIVFSRGSVNPSVHLQSMTANALTLDITFNGLTTTVMPEDIYDAMQSRVVVMVYNNTTLDLVKVVTKIVNKPNQGLSAATSIPIDKSEGYIAVSYLIPMSTADGSAISISSSLAVKDDNDIAASLSANHNAVVFQYGRSMLLGSTTYTPA